MSYILTYTGRRVDLIDPDPATIEIEDIAHGLSHMCRFNGHCRHFYSVAEHSWHVALLVSRENALQGLLHDATEAYIADITRPLKPHLTNYADIEARLHSAITARFGLSAELPAEVKHADLVLLATERRDLMPATIDRWPVLDGIEPMPYHLAPMAPPVAKDVWLEFFRELAA